jgi:tetratricopeptide (TPR) repeat protein
MLESFPLMYRIVVGIAIVVTCAYSQTSPQELLDKAVAAQKSGQLEEAVRIYHTLLDKFPDIAEIRSNLGAALAGEGRYSEAVTEYKRALELKPDPTVRLNLALAYYKTEQLPLAVDTLKKAREEAPANQQVLTVLADCYLRLGRNKEVIDLLSPVQKADPENPTFNYLLGTALVRDGQAANGQVIIDKILKNGDSAEALLLMGITKFMVKDFAGALADFQKAIDLNPELPDLYAYYGLALLTTGDQAGAKKAFEQELRRDPNNFDANLRLGVLFRQDHADDEALKFLQHALQIRPGDFGVRYQIACVELAKQELEPARRDLEALVREAPEFTEAHVTLATVYFREKKKAEGDRERAIVLKLNAERQAQEPGAVPVR